MTSKRKILKRELKKKKEALKPLKREVHFLLYPEHQDRSKEGLEKWYAGVSKEKDYLATRYKEYILAPGQFARMAREQDYKCAICFKEETAKSRNGKARALSIDHCHKTRTVRGLLCGKCNTGLGMYNDSIELLEQAIDYLIKFNKRIS